MAQNPDKQLEKFLFASRWLIAPMYLGLVVALGMLTFVFLHELLNYIPKTLTMSSDEVIMFILTLIDLSLVGNLLLIVMFSGYESFISRIEVGEEEHRLAWMGTVDFSGLKMKLVASIIAISAIHLLKRFMEIGHQGTEMSLSDTDLMWMVVIHVVFVVSGLLMAAMDWMSSRARK